MGTITICVDDKVEKKFRKAAEESFGVGKGKLGAAVAEALEKWVESKEQERIASEMVGFLEKGFEMGKLKFKHRSELYARNC